MTTSAPTFTPTSTPTPTPIPTPTQRSCAANSNNRSNNPNNESPTAWTEASVPRQIKRASGGSVLSLRPIQPQDAGRMAQLVHGLGPAARRNRFHGSVRLSAGHFQQMCSTDYRYQLALVVSTVVDGAEQLVADCRYVTEPDGQGAEFALMVADRWQGQGLGAWTMQALQGAATDAGLLWLNGEVLQDNLPMLGLMQRCGFALCPDAEDDRIVNAQRRLGAVGLARPVLKQSFRSWLRRAWQLSPAPLQAAAR